mmetsp:Transcript_37338/g.37670  ORF Transcript_37338/g.37670 Transcript_37338/m.37670 type:complete len:234 (+) Transcript_37338:445-1146(+)
MVAASKPAVNESPAPFVLMLVSAFITTAFISRVIPAQDIGSILDSSNLALLFVTITHPFLPRVSATMPTPHSMNKAIALYIASLICSSVPFMSQQVRLASSSSFICKISTCFSAGPIMGSSCRSETLLCCCVFFVSVGRSGTPFKSKTVIPSFVMAALASVKIRAKALPCIFGSRCGYPNKNAFGCAVLWHSIPAASTDCDASTTPVIISTISSASNDALDAASKKHPRLPSW